MRILLTHTPRMRHDYYGASALADLRELADVRLHEGAEPLGGAALIAAASSCDIVVSDRATAGEAALFDASPQLAAFVRCAVDIRNVDVEAASRNGVLVTRASPGFVASVSELVMAMMVDLARGISRASEAYHAGAVPEARMGVQLEGATLGLIGYGAIGIRVAALARAFGMRVLVTDPYAQIADADLTKVGLDVLLGEADFIVCLAVANEETENLLDAAAFAKVKRGAFLVNASRGNLVDEAALVQALEHGTLAGAAMDVGRAPDQMPTPALAARSDVIATPHTGGLTPQAIAHQADETVTQVAAILQGRAPTGAVNEASWNRRPAG
jgi:D-3-phosphoglycerate dehydrogenase